MEESASESSSEHESDFGPPPLLLQENNNGPAEHPPELEDESDSNHNCAKCQKSNHTDKKELFSAGGFKKGDNSNTEWIQCDACDKWYHIDCVKIEEFETKLIEAYHCSSCEETAGPSKLKEIVADHRYDFWKEDEIPKNIQIGTKKWIEEVFKPKEQSYPNFDEMPLFENGHHFMESFNFEQEWTTPLKILKKDGLGIELPDPDFNMDVLLKMVGADEEVDTIDVYIQTSSKMSMGKFMEKWKEEPRERLYNMLSFEFSHTELMNIIKAPELMYRLSWVHKFWPPSAVKNEDFIVVPDHIDCKPDVSMFCLLGMGGSYTDFHIDFGGSSVWYHVFRGEKVFYVIEPTDENLEYFFQWSSSEMKSEHFFNDAIPSKPMKRVVIKEGETLMIPSGWIHAVFTPIDSMVFGGNFIHELNIERQLKVYDGETRCNYDDHFLFPSFELTNWYAAWDAVNTNESISPGVIKGFSALLPYLNKWVSRDKEKNSRYQVHTLFRSVQDDLKKLINEYEREQNTDAYDPSNEKKVKALKVKLSKFAVDGKRNLKRDKSYEKAAAKAEKLSKEDKKSVKNIFKNGTQSGRMIKPREWVKEKTGVECQPGPSSGNIRPFMQSFSAEERIDNENAMKADDGYARRNGDFDMSSDDEYEIPKKKPKIAAVKEAKPPKIPKPKVLQTPKQRLMKNMKLLKHKKR